MTVGTKVRLNTKNTALNGRTAKIVEGYEPFDRQWPETAVVMPQNSNYKYRVPAYCLEVLMEN